MRAIAASLLFLSILPACVADDELDPDEPEIGELEQGLNAERFCETEGGYRLLVGDFDGDKIDDLMCAGTSFAARPGSTAILYGQPSGRFSNGDLWQSDANWCGHGSGVRLVGDFNKDGKTDMLCHDTWTGEKWVSFANTFGTFVHGTSYYLDNHWCLMGGRLVVGDFDGDDRDDLACQRTQDGYLWLDLADTNGRFGDTNFERALNWCTRTTGGSFNYLTEDLLVGDFDGDNRDDLMCKDYSSPHNAHIDLAGPGGALLGTDFVMPMCADSDYTVYPGASNQDKRVDVLCHRKWFGSVMQYLSNKTGPLFTTAHTRNGAWCTAYDERVYRGDFNGDQRDDLLCNTGSVGRMWLDYADANGFFMGTDWVSY